jgi:transcriptional regulator with XRE-family HTH domain
LTSPGKIIRSLRKKHQLTQSDLAKQIGCKTTTVANWENQHSRTPSKKMLKRLADFFHVSTDYILGINNEKKQREDKYNQLVHKQLDENTDFEVSIYAKEEERYFSFEINSDDLMMDYIA